jgi:P27 family predicted phage terminase small subunit
MAPRENPSKNSHIAGTWTHAWERGQTFLGRVRVDEWRGLVDGGVGEVSKPVPLAYFHPMTERQQAAERVIRHELQKAGHLREIDTMVVRITAMVWVEMETLQQYIDRNGTTYEVVGRSGDVYTKHRPEHQQLVEARGRLLTLIRELGMSPISRNRVQAEIEELDEIELLRQSKQ